MQLQVLASAPLHSIHASLGPRIQLDVITDTGVSGLWILGGIRVGRQCSQGNFFSFPWPAPGMVHGFQRSGQVRLDELEEPHSQGSASWGVVTHSQQHFPKGTPLIPAPTWKQMPGPRTGCCLTRAELLQEGVCSHLQSGRAGEAPAQGDVTGYDGAEARHGTTCRKRREEGAMSPCRAACAPQLTGSDTRSPCPTFQNTG